MTPTTRMPRIDPGRQPAPRWFGGLALRSGTIIRSLARSREGGVFLALVLFTLFENATVGASFSTPYNIGVILKQMSVVAVIGAGQTLVMIVGAFDLSQAALAGLTAMVPALLWSNFGLPPMLALGVGLLLGAVVGAFNGILAAYFRLNPIMLTLASGIALTGVTYFINNGYPIVGLPPEFLFLGSGEILGAPVPVLVAFLVVAVMHVMLTRTLFGRRVLQVGGNQDAAKGLGLNINRIRTAVFAISGLMAAVGGIMIVGRLGTATPQIGLGLLFPVVTAVIIGGTLLTGGAGTILGTLIGATVMAMVTNAIVLHSVNIFLIDTVQGTLVLAALLVDQLRRGELTLRKVVGRE